jgi:hypothetical protein
MYSNCSFTIFLHPQIKFTTVFPYMVDTGLCKKVKIRFETFLKLLKPSEVAAAIVSAQRKGLDELTVPSEFPSKNYRNLRPTISFFQDICTSSTRSSEFSRPKHQISSETSSTVASNLTCELNRRFLFSIFLLI